LCFSRLFCVFPDWIVGVGFCILYCKIRLATVCLLVGQEQSIRCRFPNWEILHRSEEACGSCCYKFFPSAAHFDFRRIDTFPDAISEASRAPSAATLYSPFRRAEVPNGMETQQRWIQRWWVVRTLTTIWARIEFYGICLLAFYRRSHSKNDQRSNAGGTTQSAQLATNNSGALMTSCQVEVSGTHHGALLMSSFWNATNRRLSKQIKPTINQPHTSGNASTEHLLPSHLDRSFINLTETILFRIGFEKKRSWFEGSGFLACHCSFEVHCS
jgi:hypothetical protein